MMGGSGGTTGTYQGMMGGGLGTNQGAIPSGSPSPSFHATMMGGQGPSLSQAMIAHHQSAHGQAGSQWHMNATAFEQMRQFHEQFASQMFVEHGWMMRIS